MDYILRSHKTHLIIWVLLFLLLVTGCDKNQKEAFPTPARNPNAKVIPEIKWHLPAITFPKDEAPHNTLTDWWYYSGRVETTDGHQYGIMFVIAQNIRGNYPVMYVGNFGISDFFNHKYKSEETYILTEQKKVKFGGNEGFHFDVNGWKLAGKDGLDRIQAVMQDGSYGVNLVVRDVKGIVLPMGGIVYYGKNIPYASYYYEKPRMSVSGSIMVGKEVKPIKSGLLWFDRQWGNFLVSSVGSKWEWFNGFLSDGSDLMFYTLRDTNNKPLTLYGVYVPPCAASCTPNKVIPSYNLSEKNFSTKHYGFWKSPRTGINYPINWQVTIKGDQHIPNFDLLFTPIVPDSEIVHILPEFNSLTYWENVSNINGTKNGQPITGSGFIELVGYAQ